MCLKTMTATSVGMVQMLHMHIKYTVRIFNRSEYYYCRYILGNNAVVYCCLLRRQAF